MTRATPAQLKTISDALDARSSERSSNAGSAGWWSQIADAAEELAGSTTTANDSIAGYMQRAAVALEALEGTSGAEENATQAGLLKRIVDALENNSTVGTGSLAQRAVTAASAFRPELISNGDFLDGATDWDTTGVSTGVTTISGGIATLDGGGFSTRAILTQPIATKAGRTYEITTVVADSTSTAFAILVGTTRDGQEVLAATTMGVGAATHTHQFTAVGTTSHVGYREQGLGTAQIDSVSVREVL